ncbi:fatty acid--CoA ligase family protein [Sphingobium sp. Sx8-8]|uniref:class I adenylate-forming enzyme family protein n=1 Tax=Sphingobium sp. Sx8-8 TaxID=2933617 RepID=UPI001F5AB88D|nr:fatty acid--CoA ligase family protein [Sphingobium sp. Sx8-8]
MTGLPELIAAVLAIDPAAEAVEFEGRWESWGGLHARMAAIDSLIASQVRGGNVRVGVMLRNRLPHLSALYAAVTGGRCLVTLNPLYPDAVIASDIAALRLPVIVAARSDLERPGVAEAARDNGTALIALPDAWDEAPVLLQPHDPARGANPAAPGIMIEMLTSGTTGIPKRVPITRAAFEASFNVTLRAEGALDERPQLRPGVAVSPAPLTHIGGVWGSLTSLCLGRRFVLLERFSVPVWADAIRRHRPRATGLTAAGLRMILDADIPAEALSSLKVVSAGAAPTDPALIDAFMDRYGIPVLTNYGATEFAGPVARWTLPDFKEKWREKRGSVGRLHGNVEGRVVDPATGETLPPGEEGVLELRAAQLIDPSGWLRTTDKARLDADGYLWITGRADGVINRGGFKVSPEDIVRRLEEHPAIREAAVVGVADERLGQVPAAAIILKRDAAPLDEAELSAYLRQSLAPYQVPVHYRIMDDFPRTASMKPVLPEIAKLFIQNDL